MLSAVRAGEVALSAELVDLLLDSLDQVSGWLDRIDAAGVMPDGADGISRELTAALRAVLPANFGAADIVAAPVAVLARAAWLHELAEADLNAAFAAARNGASVLAVEYVPARDCFFSGEDPFGVVREIPGLLSLAIDTAEPLPSLDVLDPYRCVLRFRLLTTASRHEIEHLFRYVIEQVRLATLMPAALSVDSDGFAFSPMAARLLDSQRMVLDLGRASPGQSGRLASVGRTVGNLLTASGGTAELDEWEATYQQAEGVTAPDLLIALLDGWLARLPVELPRVEPTTRQAKTSARQDSGDVDARPANRVLKVDQARIDTLMNLIGELVVAKNSLPFLARRAEKHSWLARDGPRDQGSSTRDRPHRAGDAGRHHGGAHAAGVGGVRAFSPPGARCRPQAGQAGRTGDRGRGHRSGQECHRGAGRPADAHRAQQSIDHGDRDARGARGRRQARHQATVRCRRFRTAIRW